MIIPTIIILIPLTLSIIFNPVQAQAPQPTEPIQSEEPLIRPEVPKKEKKQSKAVIKPKKEIKKQVQPVKIKTFKVTTTSDIDKLLVKYFGKASNNARRIMMCESGGRPTAKGDIKIQFWQDGILYGASYGLFQIRYLQGRPTPDKLVNPEFNIRYASDLYKWHGWRPWLNCARKNGLL